MRVRLSAGHSPDVARTEAGLGQKLPWGLSPGPPRGLAGREQVEAGLIPALLCGPQALCYLHRPCPRRVFLQMRWRREANQLAGVQALCPGRPRRRQGERPPGREQQVQRPWAGTQRGTGWESGPGRASVQSPDRSGLGRSPRKPHCSVCFWYLPRLPESWLELGLRATSCLTRHPQSGRCCWAPLAPASLQLPPLSGAQSCPQGSGLAISTAPHVGWVHGPLLLPGLARLPRPLPLPEAVLG